MKSQRPCKTEHVEGFSGTDSQQLQRKDAFYLVAHAMEKILPLFPYEHRTCFILEA